MNCLVCHSYFYPEKTWESLFFRKKDEKVCADCLNQLKIADTREDKINNLSLVSLYSYTPLLKTVLHQYKFLQDVALAEVFTARLRQQLATTQWVVPIPLSEEKRRERTFAHIEQLLQTARIPFHSVLEKTVNITMSKLDRNQRLAAPNFIQVRAGVTIQPVTYTLVDDLVTTGTTVQQAAEALYQAGARQVQVVVLSAVPKK